MFILLSMRFNNNIVYVYLCLFWIKYFFIISVVVFAFGEWEFNGVGMVFFYIIVFYLVIRDYSIWLISYGLVVYSIFVFVNKYCTVIFEYMKGRKF